MAAKNVRNQEDNLTKIMLDAAADTAIKSGLKYASDPAGVILSRYGKKLINYWIADLIKNHKSENGNIQQEEKQVPPFVVVGLGRCGCHVAAELAQLIETSQSQELGNNVSAGNKKFLSSLFGNPENTAVFKFDPIMLVGDIDETTYDDVDGLIKDVSKNTKDRLLRLDYQPLAEGGVGHVPIFAEFLTKSLLLLPHNEKENTSLSSQDGKEARKFITTFNHEGHDIPRLVFYIFSTGGGTGAGSASEIMKAQSYSKIKADIDREMYFTGTAILPEDITFDQRKLINTGRTIIQYLANLNIQLDCPEAYDRAPNCIAGSYIEIQDDTVEQNSNVSKEKPIMPWNGLAFISNDVMNAPLSEPLSFEQVEAMANRYIAQQMFNLAAAQYSAAGWDKDNLDRDHSINPKPTKKNYQAIRLDPNDLKTGLIGPYAIAFAVLPWSESIEEDSIDVIDNMILRAIDIPKYSEKFGSANDIIEGISISPINKVEYAQLIKNIRESNQEEILSKESFKELNEKAFFQKCPRIICSFTAPQKKDIPNIYKERIEKLMNWIFPNLI